MRADDQVDNRVGIGRLTPGGVALTYAGVGLLWIGFSDVTLAWWLNEPIEWVGGQLLKGAAFIAVTAVVLWLVLRSYVHSLEQTHRRLRQSRRTLGTLLSNLPGMAYRCRTDERLTLLFASEGGRDLTGYDVCDPRASFSLASLIDERDAARVRRQVNEALELGRPFQLTYRIRAARGQVRWVWEQGRAVDGGDGGDVLEGFITDITEQTRAREALQRSENRYRMLIETALEGILIMDRSTRITFANPQIGRLLGYSVPELVGRSILDFIDPTELDDMRQRLERRWQGQAEQYETCYRRRDGRRVWGIVTTNPVFDDEGNVIGALGMVTDITQRVATEQKLRESERRHRALADSRKLLLNELDHRVKNNLAGLHALLSMYARGAKTVEDFAEFMRQKLIAMTTVHEMTAAANWEPLHLGELISHTATQFRGPEMADVSIATDGPPVTIPPRQAGPLIMILHELLTNSRKHGAYRRSGGHIAIAWEVGPAEGAEPDGHRAAQDHQSEGAGEGGREGDRRLVIRWTESGGPRISQPSTAGLGLGLVEGFIRHELNGRFAYHMPPHGFRCTIEITLDPAPAPHDPADTPDALAGPAAEIS